MQLYNIFSCEQTQSGAQTLKLKSFQLLENKSSLTVSCNMEVTAVYSGF